MPDVSDLSLLQDYFRHASEEAFAELVRRHVNLVYSTALRHAGIPAQAEEISQAVFVILARKAGNLRPDTVLEAWLYETTRLTSLSFLRGERRRQFREQEAYMQSTIQEHADASTWNQFAPLLDDAMARLGKKDREAVVLRFFKEKNLREVAIALNVSETAAQSRVHRALEKLRRYFSRHGFASTTAIIANEISAHSVHVAPAGLAKAISVVAVTKGATASVSTLTLVKGALKTMAWTKVQTAIAAGVIVLLGTATATITVKHVLNSRNDSAWEVENPKPEMLNTLPPLVKIVPTKFPNLRGSMQVSLGPSSLGIAVYLESILRTAYNEDALYDPNKKLWMLRLTKIPLAKYDYIANFGPPKNLDEVRQQSANQSSGNVDALQMVLKKQFGLVGDRETIVTNVLLLKIKYPDAPGLEPVTAENQVPPNQKAGEISFQDHGCRTLAAALENDFRMPVLDETGLTSSYYYDLKWTPSGVPRQNQINLKQALLDELGLELVPTNMPVEMLVVGKSN